eukprot:scaffold368_cov258-Pinguiococcus_pyrenoidosus.AAC.62
MHQAVEHLPLRVKNLGLLQMELIGGETELPGPPQLLLGDPEVPLIASDFRLGQRRCPRRLQHLPVPSGEVEDGPAQGQQGCSNAKRWPRQLEATMEIAELGEALDRILMDPKDRLLADLQLAKHM